MKNPPKSFKTELFRVSFENDSAPVVFLEKLSNMEIYSNFFSLSSLARYLEDQPEKFSPGEMGKILAKAADFFYSK